MQLEVKRGFSLLELLVVLALLGILYFAFSGIIFRSHHQAEQWLDISLGALFSEGIDQSSRYERPYRLLLREVDSELLLVLQCMDSDSWKDVQVLKVLKGISVDSESCLGASVVDDGLTFLISPAGMEPNSKVAFHIYKRGYEYTF